MQKTLHELLYVNYYIELLASLIGQRSSSSEFEPYIYIYIYICLSLVTYFLFIFAFFVFYNMLVSKITEEFYNVYMLSREKNRDLMVYCGEKFTCWKFNWSVRIVIPLIFAHNYLHATIDPSSVWYLHVILAIVGWTLVEFS